MSVWHPRALEMAQYDFHVSYPLCLFGLTSLCDDELVYRSPSFRSFVPRLPCGTGTVYQIHSDTLVCRCGMVSRITSRQNLLTTNGHTRVHVKLFYRIVSYRIFVLLSEMLQFTYSLSYLFICWRVVYCYHSW